MSTQEMALSKIDVEDYSFVHADDATVVIENCRAPKPMIKRAREEAYTFVHANDATTVTNNCGAPLQKKKKASSTKNHDSLCATPPTFDGIDTCRDDEEEENVDEIKQEKNFNLMKGRVRRYGAGLVSGMVGSLSRSSLAFSQNSELGSVKSAGSGSFSSPSMGGSAAIAVPTNTSMEINKNGTDCVSKIWRKQQRLLLLHHSVKCSHKDGRCTTFPLCGDTKRLWKHMLHCADKKCKISHCFSSRSVLSHYHQCKDQQCAACGPLKNSVRNGQSKTSQDIPSNKSSDSSGRHHDSSCGGQSQPILSGSNTQIQNVNMTSPSPEGMDSTLRTSKGSESLPQQPRSQPMPPPTPGVSVSAPTNDSMASDSFNVGNMNGSLDPSNCSRSNQTISDRDPLDISPPLSRSHQPDSDFGDSEKKTARGDAEWESKIKHKQRRLLLLYHASKCQYEDGTCPVTRFCPSMKKLWKHMADCKDKQCKVQHCVSSVYVLRHYKRCKYVHCSACGPVKETIRKSHETEKLRQVYETFSI